MKKNVFKYILDILLGIIIAFLLIYALRLKERYNPNLNFNLKVNSSYQELAISDEELNKIDLVSRNFVNNFKSPNVDQDRILKYFVRDDLKILDDIRNENPVWTSKINEINSLINHFKMTNFSFQNISQVKIQKLFNSHYLVDVTVDSINPAIFTLDVVYEEMSNQYKVNKVMFEYQRDYLNAINYKEVRERLLSRGSVNVFGTFLRYNPSFKNYNYLVLDNRRVVNIYNANKDKVLLLNGENDSYVSFFVRSGVVLTSIDALDELDNLSLTFNGEKVKVDGIIKNYEEVGLTLLKLDREVGVGVDVSYDEITSYDNVVTISSSLGLGLTISSGYKITGSDDSLLISMPLTKKDNSSPIFNRNLQLVGINTVLAGRNSSFNVALSVKYFKHDFKRLANRKFSRIKVLPKNTDSDLKLAKNVKLDKNIPAISDLFPVTLNASFRKGNFKIYRYTNKSDSENSDIIKLYVDYLTDNGFALDNGTYKKDSLRVSVKDYSGYIVVIVEGA